MAYRTIRDEKNKRRIIIDAGSSVMERVCTPSLKDDELKLVLLKADGCPMEEDRFCIGIRRYELPSICIYLRVPDYTFHSFLKEPPQKSHPHIICTYKEEAEKKDRS
jgi:hypothetical protein